MSIDRAPRGIPTGGQFVTTARTEPRLTLVREPAAQESPGPLDRTQNLTVHRDGTIVDRRTGQPVPEGTLTVEEKTGVFDPWAAGGQRRSRQAPPQRPARRSGLREDVLDELLETGEAIRGVAGHLADVHRGGVAAPATQGSFVGWGQLVPKFLRRK